MGRRNSLSNLINLQRFRHHHGGSHHHHQKHDEESTRPVKPLEKHHRLPSKQSSISSSSSSILQDDFSVSSTAMRRHSTGFSSKTVRFGDCHIRSYSQVLGDHPYCSMGCPVELGWEYSKEDLVKVNDFEDQRSHQRRHTADLLLSPEERRSILSSSQDKNQQDSAVALRKACRRQCTRKAQRKIQREFFASN